MTQETPTQRYHDPNDSGLWKLVISISHTEMMAIMKHTDDTEAKPQLMFRIPLEGEENMKLRQIEGAVYDNPRIMDDYATEIILTTPKTIWLPGEMMDDEELESSYFTEVYPCEPEDITSNSNEEEGCVFTFIPGLLSFLNRTLPGCRIYSHLFLLNREFQNKNANATRIYLSIRNGEFDMLAYHNGELVSASTHEWTGIADMAYYVFLLADAYTIDTSKLEVFISGAEENKKALEAEMKKILSHVYLLKEPKNFTELEVPLATAYSLEK